MAVGLADRNQVAAELVQLKTLFWTSLCIIFIRLSLMIFRWNIPHSKVFLLLFAFKYVNGERNVNTIERFGCGQNAVTESPVLLGRRGKLPLAWTEITMRLLLYFICLI